MTTRLTKVDIAWIKRILDECIHAQRLHQSLLHHEMLVKRPRIDRDIVDGMEITLAKLESLRAMLGDEL